jgi:hypothetical protein
MLKVPRLHVKGREPVIIRQVSYSGLVLKTRSAIANLGLKAAPNKERILIEQATSTPGFCEYAIEGIQAAYVALIN